MNNKITFKNNRIKMLRTKSNLSQQEVAGFIGTSQANLSRWEVGKIAPSIIQCWKLADFFNCSLDLLTGREIPEKTDE